MNFSAHLVQIIEIIIIQELIVAMFIIEIYNGKIN